MKVWKFQVRLAFTPRTGKRAFAVAGRKLFAEGVNGVAGDATTLTPVKSVIVQMLIERYIGKTLEEIDAMTDADFERVFGFRAPADDADTDA